MDGGGFNWTILLIVGPLLLLGVIAWAALRNRSTPAQRDDTERATHHLYEEEDRAHRREGDDVP